MSSETISLTSARGPLGVVQQTANDTFVHDARRAMVASIAAHERLLGSDMTIDQIAAVSRTLTSALLYQRKVLLFGNGGSAADAQHIAAEFVGALSWSVLHCQSWRCQSTPLA